MAFQHLTDRCFEDAIGPGGLARADYEPLLAATAAPLAALANHHGAEKPRFLTVPARRDDLAVLAPLADGFAARFETVVVLGTGGSSLGGQAICALADAGFGPRRGHPRLVFIDNIDPDSLDGFWDSVDVTRTGFVAISKSGATAETVAQLCLCLERLGDRPAGEHVVIVTEPGDNPLRALAGRFAIPTFDHDSGLGGRYSALSVTGALPALIAGLDMAALRAGAEAVCAAALNAASPADSAPAVGAALNVALARSRGGAATVLMPYVDRLRPFAAWVRQLWAESLGKQGGGTTPIPAVGATDQHSQLQLYLAGPRDKLFTLILLARAGTGGRISPDIAVDPRLAYLAGRTLGDLMAAEQEATADALARNGRPVRVLRLPRLDERALGAMMMHFMLETVIAGHLLGVDPFDQPAVEEGKILARERLAAMASAAADGVRS